MILTGIAVFFFGTAVYAGPFIPYGKAPAEIVISKHSSADKITEYYPSSGGSPFISNFIQKGTNVFFKPQFMLSAAQMPPQVQTMIAAIEKDDCKTTLPMGPIPMIIEEPLRVVQQEIIASSKPIVKEVIEMNSAEYNQHIKPTIELTPAISPALEMHVLELPKMPVVIEESAELETPCPPGEVVVIPPAPELPTLELPKLSVLEEIPLVQVIPETPAIIEVPPAPVLPPLEMPKLPVLVEEPMTSYPPEKIEEVVVSSFIPNSYIREVVISPPEAPVLSPYVPELPEIIVAQKPVVIPQPPELPPFSAPKLPLSVVVKEEVVISPEVPSLPCEEVKSDEEIKPMIPEAPILSPYIPLDVPQPIILEEPVSVVVENEILEPVSIPAAPVLPPLKMPELPVVIEESGLVPCPPNEVHISPPFVPEAPVLPPLSLPELPVQVEVEKRVEPCDTVELVESVVIPEAPILTPYVPIEIPSPVLVEEPVTVEIQNPAIIPSAPVLPPLELSQTPVIVEESVAPCPPEHEFKHSKVVIESRPVAMPVSYVFSESSLSRVSKSEGIILTSTPEFLVPYFPVVTEKLMKEEPASCVHDIVVERILPKLEKSLELKSTKVPVSTYLAPLRYALF